MQDNQKVIKKVICIGGNCIAADIMHTLGVRVPGPVDNISGFNIWKSHFLFDKGIKKLLFFYPHKVRESTESEKEKYHYWDKIFMFKRGFYIVHNNFDDRHFKKSINRRINGFYKYYKKSRKNESLWYIYSLEQDDKNLTREHLQEIKSSLPECCTSRLICIGMRGKNPLFQEFFNYYIEFESEDDYKWHDKAQALAIKKFLEKTYDLHFEIGR